MKGTGRPHRQPARVFAAGPEVVHARCAPPSLPQARPVVRRPKVLEPSRACGCRKRCRHMRPGQICGSSRRVPASPATPRQGPERLRYRRYTTGPAAADPRRLLLGSGSRYILGTTSRDHESCPASGRHRRPLPAQWSRPIQCGCLLRACSDATVRTGRTRYPRHFASRGCGTAPHVMPFLWLRFSKICI